MEVSQIGQIVRTQARGKEEFISAFSRLCYANYEKFLKELRHLFMRGEAAKFKSSVHKIQTLNKLFECQEFHEYLSGLSADPDLFFGNEEALDRITSYCDLISDELNTMRA